MVPDQLSPGRFKLQHIAVPDIHFQINVGGDFTQLNSTGPASPWHFSSGTPSDTATITIGTNGAVIDWIPFWDNAWLLALRPQLPQARLLFALRDPRDMLLEWFAFGTPMAMRITDIDSAAQWLAAHLSQIADVILEDVHVDGDALLGGEEGIGFRAAMQSLDNGRLSVAAASVGYAKRMLDAGLQYAMERKAFGEPIANFQLIQQMLADSEIEIYAAEAMMKDVTARADRGENILVKAAAFKVFASEMCGRVVDRVVQIYGGAGYLAEYDAERFFRDARIYRIYEGTTQILQLQIAKHMLREWAADQ